MPDRAEPIVVNRYLTARGDEKSVTLYWYQSRSRIIAGEFSAKFWLIADSIRYHRSDSRSSKWSCRYAITTRTPPHGPPLSSYRPFSHRSRGSFRCKPYIPFVR